MRVEVLVSHVGRVCGQTAAFVLEFVASRRYVRAWFAHGIKTRLRVFVEDCRHFSGDTKHTAVLQSLNPVS